MPTITENLSAHLEAAGDALARYNPPSGRRERQIQMLESLADQVRAGEITPDELHSRLTHLETEIEVIQARHDLAQARQYVNALPRTNDGGRVR